MTEENMDMEGLTQSAEEKSNMASSNDVSKEDVQKIADKLKHGDVMTDKEKKAWEGGKKMADDAVRKAEEKVAQAKQGE